MKKNFMVMMAAACLVLPVSTKVFSGSVQMTPEELAITFDRHYGEVEVGGRYAGVEFQKSMALPSRISFFYPVANSIDKTADYWKRYDSKPFKMELTANGKTAEIGYEPYTYSYTPFFANFTKSYDDYNVAVSYGFCDDMPVCVFKVVIRNKVPMKLDYSLTISQVTSLHSCHTYTEFTSADVKYIDNNTVGITDYGTNLDLGNSAVFIANSGDSPASCGKSGSPMKDPSLSFTYRKTLNPQEELTIIQLVGSCKSSELNDMIARSRANWKSSLDANNSRVMDYVNKYDTITTNNPALNQNSAWSKAMITSLSHYIRIPNDGTKADKYIQMPCPAEYNFYFTHDVLVTGFGMVYFDPAFVKNGYDFIWSLVKQNNDTKPKDEDPEYSLPQAYYWKGTEEGEEPHYQTEWCDDPTNWNNLWIVISTASYLKHSNDLATVKKMFPIVKNSMDNALLRMGKPEESKDGIKGLMYAYQMDWWDIAHNEGPRAYMCILTYRALQCYAYIVLKMNEDKYFDNIISYLNKADQIKSALNKYLWIEDKGFLYNILSDKSIDQHYYIGSLLAPLYGLLDQDKSTKLLATAEKELLDKELGVRNAMPMNFDELEDLYQFSNHEEGPKGCYMNGSVWPQGNAWYALSLISNGQLDKAEDVVKKYLTVYGIMNSPNGTPSYYECRTTLEGTFPYGQIDKPTFLWTGGWYFYTLYQLAGVRENPWNISFNPRLPSDFGNISYQLALMGKACQVSYLGSNGDYFSRITFDGKDAYTAVANKPVSKIELTRGVPSKPYLASAQNIVDKVAYVSDEKAISINLIGLQNEKFEVSVVSPFDLKAFTVEGVKGTAKSVKHGDVNVIKCSGKLPKDSASTLKLEFK